MNRRHALVAAPALLAALALGACARPIYNVPGRNFDSPAPFEARSEQIRRAGGGLGWQMEPVRPGVMRGTLNLRSHVAVVEITYSADAFAINYVDSRNLGYDGTSIHKNYNGWIENLERAIAQQPAG
jgi:hypothetical protein